MRTWLTSNTVRGALIFAVPVLFAFSAAGQATTSDAPDPRAIIQRSVERDAQNYELLSRYTYTVQDVERRFNGDGDVTSSESKTYEVMMLAGSPYERVIAEDGEPLSDREAEKQQEKLDKELAKRLKNPEKERADYEKERAEQREFVREIPEAFDFTLLGTEEIRGRPAWKIHATPRQDFEPQHSRADNLKKVRGTVWVDQADYQWVRADLEVIDTITWGWFVVRIQPGGEIHFEQRRINDEIWLPSEIHIRADVRVALLKTIRAAFDTTYSDYRRFETESQIVDIESLAAPE